MLSYEKRKQLEKDALESALDDCFGKSWYERAEDLERRQRIRKRLDNLLKAA